MKLPVHLDGQTIRDAENRVVVSAINPCDMAERRQIVDALNATVDCVMANPHMSTYITPPAAAKIAKEGAE